MRIGMGYAMTDKPAPWGRDGGNSWEITLFTGEGFATFDYFTGSAVSEPSLGSVLNSLSLDVSALEDETSLDDALHGLTYCEAANVVAVMKANERKLYGLCRTEAEWESVLAYDWESVPEEADWVDIPVT